MYHLLHVCPTPTKHVLLTPERTGRKCRTNSETTRTLVSEFKEHLFVYTPPHCSTGYPLSFALPFGTMPKTSRAVRNTTPDIVRVRGRYRVGKPLGSGTFGMFVLRSYRMRYSDLYRKCLLRKGHQDWGRCSLETRGRSRLEFKSCARIQRLSGYFRTLRDPQGVLVREGRTVSCPCPRSPW
jgi:hypothetical protein